MSWNPSDETNCIRCGKKIKKGKTGRIFCTKCDNSNFRLNVRMKQ